MTASPSAVLRQSSRTRSAHESAETQTDGTLDTAGSRMDAFIGRAKELLQLQPHATDWHEPRWEFHRLRGTTKHLRSCFADLQRTPFPQPFGDQARAIMADAVFRDGRGDVSGLMRVLRYLLRSLQECNTEPDLVLLEQRIVNHAGSIIERELQTHSRRHAGRNLQYVVSAVLEKQRLTDLPVSFASPFKKRAPYDPDHLLVRSKQSNANRKAKLPNLEAVLHLGRIFSNPGTGESRHYCMVVSSFAALAMLAPSRACEILTLPCDCVTQDYDTKRKRTRKGISWSPAKGGRPMTKFAVTKEFEKVMLRAVESLRVMGRRPRAAAEWYQNHPDQLYLPPGTEHLRGQPLSCQDVSDIIGFQLKSHPETRTARDMALALAADGCSNLNACPQDSLKKFISCHIAGFYDGIPSHLEPVARCLEEFGRLLPPGDPAVSPDQPLSFEKALSLIGLTVDALTGPDLNKHLTKSLQSTDADSDGSRRSKARNSALCSFESLQAWVLGRLQPVFPVIDEETGLAYSKALFCLPSGVMGNGRTFILWNVPNWPDYDAVHQALGNGKAGDTSIFTMNNLVDSETGKLCKVRTHRFRHLLNNIAQQGSVSQNLIAFWSGRRNASENQAYDHISQKEIIGAWQMAQSEAETAERVLAPLRNMVNEMVRDRTIDHEEAKSLKTGAVHVTRYGLCRHDFSLMPCPYDVNCINCAENVFVAHDSRMISEARNQIQIQNNALMQCRKAIGRGEPGVEYYLKMHTGKLDRWEQALQLMTDTDTEPGTIIRLPSISNADKNASGKGNETLGPPPNKTTETGKSDDGNGQHKKSVITTEHPGRRGRQ